MRIPENQIFRGVVSQLFESWGMVFPDADECALGSSDRELYHVQVFFDGESLGKVDIWLNDVLAKTVAMNVLGHFDVEEVSEEEMLDTLRELGNLACGHFLSTFYDNKMIFNVGMPMVKAETFKIAEAASKACFMVEGQEVFVSVQPGSKN